MTTFGITFLIVLLLATATRLWLGMRHVAYVQAHRGAVPAQFCSDVTLAAHQRAADYTSAKTRLGLVSVAVDALLVLWLTLGGGLQWLYEMVSTSLSPGIGRELGLVGLLAALAMAIELPISIYRTFGVEAKFGFNKMTPALFIKDLAKGTLLAIVLGGPLIAAILWLMEHLGEYWWVYAWAVMVTFSLLITFIFPTVIAPLFNKFSPLEDAEIKQRVSRLLDRCGFRAKGLFVMDGSLRSSHGNAYFTGFGKTKRIIFFDTLLARLSPSEVEAVLAHELGHFKLRHVVKRLVITFAVTLGFFWLLGFVMTQEWFFTGLGVTSRSTAMALILLYLVVPFFTVLLQPLSAVYSRKHEFEADHYAAQNASAGDLASALVKLYKDNASTLTPDPVHSAFYDSHPPALARISRLQQAREAS